MERTLEWGSPIFCVQFGFSIGRALNKGKAWEHLRTMCIMLGGCEVDVGGKSPHSKMLYSSGKPPFRTSEMWTSRFNRRFAQVRIAFPLTTVHYNPEVRTHRYSVKCTGVLVPLVH